MATLAPGQTLRSREALLAVENALAPGSYAFTLTVVDDAGNESAPVQLGVTVVRQRPPPPPPPPPTRGPGGPPRPFDPPVIIRRPT